MLDCPASTQRSPTKSGPTERVRWAPPTLTVTLTWYGPPVGTPANLPSTNSRTACGQPGQPGRLDGGLVEARCEDHRDVRPPLFIPLIHPTIDRLLKR